MSLDVIWMGRLLNPVWTELRKLAADAKSVGQGPVLICIEHHRAFVTDQLAQHGCAALIPALFRRTDLEFECGEPLIQSFLCQLRDLFIVIVHPAHGRVISGIAALENDLSLRTAGQLLMQHCDSFLFGKYLFKVAEVENPNQFFRREVEQELPKWYTLSLRPQIETGVCNWRQRQLHNAFVWTKPSQRRVIGDLPGNIPKVRHYGVDGHSLKWFGAHLDGFAHGGVSGS